MEIASIDCIDPLIDEFVKKRKERVITAVKKRISGLNTDRKITKTRKQKWEGK